MITKDELKALLKKHVMQINFRKVDGTERNMTCTLLEDVVKPYESKSEVKRVKKDNDDVLAVWDTTKNSFRSFRLDSLISYSVLEQGYEL